MLDFDTAQAQLAAAGGHPSITEKCSLSQARGRVLAQTLFATLDLPPADNSAMDGYAIRHADYAAGKSLPVQQRCYAGAKPQDLLPGSTIRLFTGSLLPKGADTVVMQEDADESNDELLIQHVPKLGSHIRHRGEDIRAGEQLFAKGSLLGAAQIAMLASQGYAEVSVYPALKVGILTTGDELVNPGQPRSDEHIYNSNGTMLAALVENMGARAIHVLHALDTEASLQSALATLLQDCDLVLTVGGVSVGEKDLVKPAIEQFGGSLDLWRVCMKPGKPVALAHAANKPIVCLPGNPVSAFAVFTLLVSPLLRSMQGRTRIMPPLGYGKLSTQKEFKDSREEFLRVNAQANIEGHTHLKPYPQQGSGIISSLSWASGLARIPANTSIKDGDIVPYYDFQHWLA
ncbi:gephyrin-like molybdotransferase Glp [Pollutimonas harenae]|uniref:Molybdopterin molybdenumtransferase n=1 Tax=Pollutimonas harenae TaxID=657015 RepID=A0A853H3P6_9BURK|nr:gephyrin-like molybdotransferase Glp [Pollutimonas harenae]NYT86852.1 molybdopterin molybdotransferase MoeA [Pollutimonas harenae]TEA69430.1 molybdopterin molybdotransferase MoeA [Pollutimonas harenae]